MTDQIILWAIVAAYIIFVFSKGVLKAKRIEGSDDFLVAGRNVGWFFLFCTMGATVIGGGASIGAIGKTYEWGILMLVVSMGWYIHFIFAGLVVAPRFREAKLYTVAGYFGHRFGEGPRFLVLILSLLFSVFIVAAQMAAFGSVFAAIMPGSSASWDGYLKLAIILGGGMVVVYSTAGGLLAVIHTDVYQFIVLILGFVITLGFCVPDILESHDPVSGKFIPTHLSRTDVADPVKMASRLVVADDPGARQVKSNLSQPTLAALQGFGVAGVLPRDFLVDLLADLNALIDGDRLLDPDELGGLRLSRQTEDLLQTGDRSPRRLQRLNLSFIQDIFSEELTPNRKIPDNFFLLNGGKGWIFLITTFFAFLLGETFAPGYATRYCVGKDIRNTRIGIAGVGVFLVFTFPVILFFIALYARIHFPDIPAQQALPMVVRQLNNPVIGGLIIGALLMAVMSSADSALNSSTAIFVKDLFEHQLGWKNIADARTLLIARLCSAGLGLVAIVIAVLWSDIIGLLLFTYHVWAPAIILPVCVGVLTRGKSPRLNRNIFITMLVATGATMFYRFLPFLKNSLGLDLLPQSGYAFLETFDPSVFGVAVSCATFGLLTLGTRDREGPTG